MRFARQSALPLPLSICSPSFPGNEAEVSPAEILFRAAAIVSASPPRNTGLPSRIETAWKRTSSSFSFRAANRERAAALESAEPSGKPPGRGNESVAPSGPVERLYVN